MIKPFNSEGDLVACQKKLKLVAKIQMIPDFESFHPLFIEGALY